jgi:UDP-N-acetylglucosamine 2-epimerase (non-hydrolysing)
MPEEINRKLTDQISRWLFVTEESGVENLAREGIPADRVHLVGNVMIDTLLRCRDVARERSVRSDLGLDDSPYVLMTMHRPSNVDDPDALERVVEMMQAIGSNRTVVFPMHPRTRERLEENGLRGRADAIAGLRILEPLGYLDFLQLLDHAGAVVTDSGGIQEETTFLGVPCITVRDNTERPVTVEMGTNQLVALDAEAVARRVDRVMDDGGGPHRVPPLWDGEAAVRIAEILQRDLGG